MREDRRVNEMRIFSVHECDSSWEDDQPRFRVYLHGSGESETHGWTDTYDVTGADVLQVIDWAQRQAGGQLTYAIALVSDLEHAGGESDTARGLTWLVGIDGNEVTDDDAVAAERQRRMLARRACPVVVPHEDRMPDELLDPYNDGTHDR